MTVWPFWKKIPGVATGPIVARQVRSEKPCTLILSPAAATKHQHSPPNPNAADTLRVLVRRCARGSVGDTARRWGPSPPRRPRACAMDVHQQARDDGVCALHSGRQQSRAWAWANRTRPRACGSSPVPRPPPRRAAAARRPQPTRAASSQRRLGTVPDVGDVAPQAIQGPALGRGRRASASPAAHRHHLVDPRNRSPAVWTSSGSGRRPRGPRTRPAHPPPPE